MMLLFDTRREFLVQEYIPEFKEMNHEDLLDFQRSGEDKNLTNRIKINKINERAGIQNLMRQIVDAIQPSRSGISHNSLIKIYGEEVVTYTVVLYYMASKMNVDYVENDSAEEHLRSIRIDGIITAGMVESNGNVKCTVHQSSYQYRGIRSATNHVYILASVQMPEITKRELSTFIAGMERKVISETQMLGIKCFEGKTHQPRGI